MISWCLCRIYVHKDIIKELENKDILDTLILDVVRQGADSLAKTILEGMVDGKRNRGRPEKSWMNNIIKWTGMKVVDLIKSARDRKAWKTIVGRSAIVPPRPDV